MTDRASETSPQTYARIGGWLYLVVFVTGFFALFLTKLTVPGDAAATADNIASSEFMWRLGFVGELVAGVCYIAVTLILYVLLRPVNRNVSLLAAFFSLVGCAVGGVIALADFTALFFLGGAPFLKTFDPHQLQSIAYVSLKVHAFGSDVNLVFFGCYCLLLGYLIYKSGYFPKALGILLMIAFPCYIINSLIDFLAPAFAFPMILLGAFVAELALCLWLIVKGVNVQTWEACGASTEH